MNLLHPEIDTRAPNTEKAKPSINRLPVALSNPLMLTPWKSGARPHQEQSMTFLILLLAASPFNILSPACLAPGCCHRKGSSPQQHQRKPILPQSPTRVSLWVSSRVSLPCHTKSFSPYSYYRKISLSTLVLLHARFTISISLHKRILTLLLLRRNSPAQTHCIRGPSTPSHRRRVAHMPC